MGLDEVGFDGEDTIGSVAQPSALVVDHSQLERGVLSTDGLSLLTPACVKGSSGSRLLGFDALRFGMMAAPNPLMVNELQAWSMLCPHKRSLHTVVPPAASVVGEMGENSSIPTHVNYWQRYDTNMRVYR